MQEEASSVACTDQDRPKSSRLKSLDTLRGYVPQIFVEKSLDLCAHLSCAMIVFDMKWRLLRECIVTTETGGVTVWTHAHLSHCYLAVALGIISNIFCAYGREQWIAVGQE